MQLKDTSTWFRGPRYPLPVRNKRRAGAAWLAVGWGVGLAIGCCAAVWVAWDEGFAEHLEPTALQINSEVFAWQD